MLIFVDQKGAEYPYGNLLEFDRGETGERLCGER